MCKIRRIAVTSAMFVLGIPYCRCVHFKHPGATFRRKSGEYRIDSVPFSRGGEVGALGVYIDPVFPAMFGCSRYSFLDFPRNATAAYAKATYSEHRGATFRRQSFDYRRESAPFSRGEKSPMWEGIQRSRISRDVRMFPIPLFRLIRKRYLDICENDVF